jgi:hypothetical protein
MHGDRPEQYAYGDGGRQAHSGKPLEQGKSEARGRLRAAIERAKRGRVDATLMSHLPRLESDGGHTMPAAPAQ